jgi:hypothetical protein
VVQDFATIHSMINHHFQWVNQPTKITSVASQDPLHRTLSLHIVQPPAALRW